MFGAMLGVLERSGIVSADKQLEETVRILNKMLSYCKQSVSTGDNPAKMLAHELHLAVPVVVGYGISTPVARRWANQLNENGKSLAFASEIPEMDHNEIVGWMKDGRSKGFAAVFLEHGRGNSAMDKRLAATKEMLGRVAPVYTAEAIGLSPMAKMFSLVMMGDYVSAYTGILRNEDPSSNDPIDELKATLSKK
jgi:glucose/mannose-6-phosphate isomerase